MTANTDKYWALVTSEHQGQPLFEAALRKMVQGFADNAALLAALPPLYDLDAAADDQLDTIGLWAGLSRTVTVPLTGVYFAWDEAAPVAAPTLGSSVAGALGAATYFVKVTYVTAAGESLPSPEASRAVAANNVLTVTAPPSDPAALGYNVYVSTATGTETRQNGGAPVAFGTNWTEPTTGLVVGAAMPTSSVGTVATGWGQGSWQGPFDPSGGPVKMDNATFRTAIRAKIAANMWDGSYEGMCAFYDYVFGAGVVKPQDNQDMSITLFYDDLQMTTVMRSLFTQGVFQLKAMTVRFIYQAASGAPIFAWDTNTPRYQGWTGTSVWV